MATKRRTHPKLAQCIAYRRLAAKSWKHNDFKQWERYNNQADRLYREYLRQIEAKEAREAAQAAWKKSREGKS